MKYTKKNKRKRNEKKNKTIKNMRKKSLKGGNLLKGRLLPFNGKPNLNQLTGFGWIRKSIS